MSDSLRPLLSNIKFIPLLVFVFALPLHAQLYSDAGANLPNNGAKGSSMDVVAVDIDRDNDLDIILANEFQPNTILLNNGKGIFTKGTAGNLPQIVRDSEDIAYADFNNDGFIDLVFCSEDDIVLGKTNVHEYYLGDGKGKFTIAPYKLPDTEANAVATADINRDGFHDIILGNKGINTVLINDGKGNFSIENNRLPNIERTTQDIALADVNKDGYLDLFEANENGNLLHHGDSLGFFTNVTDTHLPKDLNIETRKVSFGDVDGDNDLDIFLSNVAFIVGKNPQNRLFINDGTGKFADGTDERLPADFDHTIDAIFEDIDLDEDLDIVIANVFGSPIRIYVNDGTGYFADETDKVLGAEYYRDALGVIAADFNGDGLRDLYICDRFSTQQNKKDLLLIRNSITSVPEHHESKQFFTIYPNPVHKVFHIRSNSDYIDSIYLVNQLGETVSHISFTNEGKGLFKCSLEKHSLAHGTYYLKIHCNNISHTATILLKSNN